MTGLMAPLPDLTLTGGMVIQVEAIDPSTGAAVSGVKVSAVTIFADTASGADAETGGSAPMDTSSPVWMPVDLDELNAPADVSTAGAEAAGSAVAAGAAEATG